MGSEEVSPVRHSWFLYSSRVVKCTKRARPSWRRLPKLCKDVRLVVPHQRLISKVDYCGIRGNLKLWIKDFLNHDWSPATCSRWWFVLQLVSLTSGVPQGSVLGPTKCHMLRITLKGYQSEPACSWQLDLHWDSPKLPLGVQRIFRPIIMPYERLFVLLHSLIRPLYYSSLYFYTSHTY